MAPRRKGAGRAALAQRSAAKTAESREGDVHAEWHRQVMRNAYIIAQSQLLQLAKQMEFDVDLTPWENEADEKMAEFWQQTNENVDEFCARMRYVRRADARSQQDTLPRIVADVVKSPRKRPGQGTPALSKSEAVDKTAPLSPSPSPSLRPAPHASADADVSQSDDEMLLTSGTQIAQPRSSHADQLLAPSAGHVDESQPRRDDALGVEPAPVKSTHFAKSPDRLAPLLSMTPGTGLRTKRTLSSAVLRSTKMPADPAPSAASSAHTTVPPSKTPANRFRSSFLNKSLRKAIEERNGGAHTDPDESALESSPFDDSHGEHGPPTSAAHAERAVDNKDTTDTKVETASAAPHTTSGPLDALRTRLESVRRTSTTATHPLPLLPTTLANRPADPRLASTMRATDSAKAKTGEGAANVGDVAPAEENRARPAATTRNPRAAEEAGPKHASTPPKAEPRPVPREAATPPRAAATPSRIPLALRSPSRAERPGSRLDRTPSRLDRPLSRAEGPRPLSRVDTVRSPGHTQLPRSPSRVGTAAPSSRTTPSPARPLHTSPFRVHGKAPNLAATQPTTPNRTGQRSPGKLREDRISPFRATVASSENNTAKPGPSSRAAPLTHMVPRPASPKLTVTPGAAEHEPVPSSLRSRIQGLLGFQAPAKTTRPASALATSPGRTTAPASPAREVHTALGFHEELDELEERQVQAVVGMPGSYVEPPRAKETGAAPARPVQRKVLAPARPAGKPSSASRPSLQTRPVTVASVRPPSRAPPPGRPSQARAPPGRVSTTGPTYTYDAEGKRRKVSQQPVREPPSHDERVSTESALKNKLTTTALPPAKVAGSTVRAPVRPLTGATRAWSKTSDAPRSSTLSTTNVFQQQPATTEPVDVSTEELPDVQSEYSDSEDEASIKKRKLEPSWTRGRELEDLLLQQSTVDPDEIFGFQLGPVPLDTMLPPRKGDRRRARKRTSSANWNGPDGLAQWEIDRYNERMGIQPHHRGDLS
ncbi:hypothetical protein MBRA1_001537 [Malassezia brasiliensis]|uniref:Inner centromere protein ARK-binding domain-containing protein n=1 Tax=Malassezia brasiliensis TaxID=1821822 RepID=A0AAF0DVV3_9BASI|nr:hypothetical protein MBRA1_001537 [Malassezia brasiliensis]